MDIRIKYFIMAAAAMLGLASCAYKDNYEGPNANFHGRLLHYRTGEPVYSEQPEGFQIRFIELSWGDNVTSQNFWGKYDGSFNWDYLFGYEGPKFEDSPYQKATYSVEPYDGAFIVDGDPKEKIIEVGPGESAEVDFEVIPYISINDMSYSLNGNNLEVKFKMVREAYPDRNIDMAGVIVSSQTQYLSYINAGGYEGKYSNLRGYTGGYTDGTEETLYVTLDPGKTYWMRVGARLEGQTRWNGNLALTALEMFPILPVNLFPRELLAENHPPVILPQCDTKWHLQL